MKCPTCSSDMARREGKFGEFFFCPNQADCGQKTISLASLKVEARLRPLPSNITVITTPRSNEPSIFERSNDPLVLEMRILEAQQGPLYGPSKLHPDCDRPFDPDLDDPIYDDGSDWRPW